MKIYLTLLNLDEYLVRADDDIGVFHLEILERNPSEEAKLKLKREMLRDKKRVCETVWISLSNKEQDLLDPICGRMSFHNNCG